MSEKQNGLSLLSNLKIGLFHLGSGMADVLTTGVWNRVMISDLGVAATPVSLLVSLRYFLAPLGIYSSRSDYGLNEEKPIAPDIMNNDVGHLRCGRENDAYTL